MKIFQYPALNDNYHFVITCKETGECGAVDIYDPQPFFDYVEEHSLKPVAILNTHHHNDHSGGNDEIKRKYPGIKIYGSRYDFDKRRIPQQTNALYEGDTVSIGNITFKVLEIPGHTLGHLCYYNDKCAFSGDTMFASGCGRLFEGTPQMMADSLTKLVKYLRPDIPVYCGHEYTISNLKFAVSLNKDYFSGYLEQMATKRQRNEFTIPTDMTAELKYNPFLLVLDNDKRKNILKLDNPDTVEAFAELRRRKDNF